MKHNALLLLLITTCSSSLCMHTMDKEQKEAAPQIWEKDLLKHIVMPDGTHRAWSYKAISRIVMRVKHYSLAAREFMTHWEKEKTFKQPSERGMQVLEAFRIHPEKNTLFPKIAANIQECETIEPTPAHDRLDCA